MAGDYEIPRLYQGKQSFNPSEKKPVNLISAGQMGMTTDPRTAAQLSELSHKLNQGTGLIEIGTLGMQEWDTIPTEHFHEIRRKAALSGSEVSLHAPIQGMDPAGFGERGWSETQHQIVERQLKEVVDKAAIIDVKKNMPITIHGSNYHGSVWKYDINPETGKREKMYETLMGVDAETGEAIPLKEELKYYPTEVDGKIIQKRLDPLTQLEVANRSKWDDELKKVEFERASAEKALGRVSNIDRAQYINYQLTGKLREGITQEEYEQIKQVHTAAEYVEQSEMKVNSLFNKAYTLAKRNNDEDQLKFLDEAAKRYSQMTKAGSKEMEDLMFSRDPKTRADAIFELSSALRHVQPKLIVPVEEFATEKASKTFGNVAWHSYKEHGEKAPIISIENLDQGRFGFSQGEHLAQLVEKSREEFIQAAMSDDKKKMSRKEAEKAAEKMIGVTFDVGHANISKKYGFTDEDLEKEAKAVSKYVKHVHLTDNFGNVDSHLPIGMGNVPVEKMLKALGKNAEDARKINEVGGWYQFFKTNPYPELLQAAGSPIYSSGSGPFWSETIGFQESYHSGYGQMLPQTHYESFGAGFSRLPAELGGSTAPAGSSGGRMGGGF